MVNNYKIKDKIMTEITKVAQAYNGLIQSWLNTVNNPDISDKGKLELLAQSMQEWLNKKI